jgi:hypothetical protein
MAPFGTDDGLALSGAVDTSNLSDDVMTAALELDG